MDLERLRDRAERFAQMVVAEEYQLERSRSRDAGVGALHQRHVALFDLERIAEVQRVLSESVGTEERRARFLLEHLLEGRASCAAAKEVDRRLNFFRCRAIQVGERSLFVKHLDTWASTDDLALRRRIEEEYLDVVDDEEPVFQDLLARRGAVYEELGRGSIVEALEVVSEIDIRSLVRAAEHFVNDTDAEYRDLLAWHLPRLAGVETADATAFDLRALLPAPGLRRELVARPPVPTLWPIFEKGGLDPAAGGRLVLEAHPELASGARAACFPLRVPDQVVLLENRSSEPRAHAAVLRALGCALHAAHTAADLPAEFRLFGDRSVRDASGLLFEGLLHTPAFLRDAYRMRPEMVAEWRRYAALLYLLRLRRSAALLELGIAWAEGTPAEEMRGHGSEVLARATGVKHDPRETFAQLQLPVDTARALHAEQLAVVLAFAMRERFDEDWYRNPAAGEELRGYFAEGYRYTADERSVQLSSAPLGFDPVARRVAEMLR
jgi:hypothetical protein